MLKKIFTFFSEAREDRMRSHVDYYAQKSKGLDSQSKADLRQKIHRDKLIKLREVDQIFKSLSCRLKYHCSSVDYQTHIAPVYKSIVHDIKFSKVACNVQPYEDIMEGYIKAGEFLDIVDNQQSLPDLTGSANAKSIESIPVPVDPVFSKNKLGEFQKKMNKKLPLVTPSTQVRYEQQETDIELDLKRAMILAVLFAGEGDKQIAQDKIPLYSQTRLERAAYDEKRAHLRSYRGQRY